MSLFNIGHFLYDVQLFQQFKVKNNWSPQIGQYVIVNPKLNLNDGNSKAIKNPFHIPKVLTFSSYYSTRPRKVDFIVSVSTYAYIFFSIFAFFQANFSTSFYGTQLQLRKGVLAKISFRSLSLSGYHYFPALKLYFITFQNNSQKIVAICDKLKIFTK